MKIKKKNLKLPLPIMVKLDPDVEAVLSFMLENFRADKLVDIANAVKEIAIPLWGRHKTKTDSNDKPFIPIYLCRNNPSKANDIT
ncbi:MAG TPA: hypothetical protein VEF33_13535 [Syntrophales bacterium]|nr:hypothetical protein [Syntrophales bacterium]